MSSTRTRVTVNGEMILNRIEAAERALTDIRKLIFEDLPQPGSPAGINVGAIDWRTRENDSASEAQTWAWAHAYHQSGGLKDETRQLVQEIQRTGKVEVSDYEITLSGRDKKLLNRKKLGSGRR